MTNHHSIKYLNLTLVVAFPIAWCSPLLTTSLLPHWQMPQWLGGNNIFEPDTLTVVSSIHKLWETDVFLAVTVICFALVAPMLKCLGMALIHFDFLSRKAQPALMLMGKLAMADIFILALYVVVAKGLGIGSITVDWGLYLFTAAVLLSLTISLVDK